MSSAAIDQALVAMLGSDATLLSYMTGGVYWAGEVPEGTKKFVEVSLADSEDVWVFGHRAIEDTLYLVQAVMLSTAGAKATVTAAEARIDALLDGQPIGIGSPFGVDGYAPAVIARERRLRESEPHDEDRSIRWWRRGGFYRIAIGVST
jgi:hypothetical protein